MVTGLTEADEIFFFSNVVVRIFGRSLQYKENKQMLLENDHLWFCSPYYLKKKKQISF